jgi:hypothetical protein
MSSAFAAIAGPVVGKPQQWNCLPKSDGQFLRIGLRVCGYYLPGYRSAAM